MNKISLVLIIFLASCGQAPANKKNYHLDTPNNFSVLTLTKNAQLAINPKFQDWVLFKNGTYIIFDNADTIADIKEEAIQLMKKFGPVYPGSPAGDFGVIQLDKTEGWVVSADCYGMYTYVNPTELKMDSPSDLDIGLLGRFKREKDGNDPVIVHINRKNIDSTSSK